MFRVSRSSGITDTRAVSAIAELLVLFGSLALFILCRSL